MSESSIFAKQNTPPPITRDHPLNIKMNKSSAAKKSSAAANTGDTKGKHVSGITNLFTGKPLSKLPPVVVVTKPPSSATGLPRPPSSAAAKPSAAAGTKKRSFYPTTTDNMFPPGETSYSVPPVRLHNGGSRSRRTVRRKHKSHRKSKRVRHTRRKQTRRHRHRR
jgi:hypothetical protein